MMIKQNIIQLGANMNYQLAEDQKYPRELKKFITLIKQEVLSPDIIAFDIQLFRYLNISLKQQQDRIRESHMDIQNGGSEKSPQMLNFKQQMYKSQTEKIGYLLKEYLRVRLRKIQKYCFYLYKNQSIAEKKLSQNQYIFMRSYAQMKYKYIEDAVLKNIVKAYRGLGGLEALFTKTNETKLQIETKQSRIQVPQPPLNSYVFCLITGNPQLRRFNADIPCSNVEQRPIINFNSTIFGQYKYFIKFINDSNGQLL